MAPSTAGATPGNHGFTLVEVLVAIVLLSVVMTSIYAIFSTISATQQRLEQQAEISHQARVIFDRVSRELRGAHLNLNDGKTAFTGGTDSNGDAYLGFTSTSSLLSSGEDSGLVRVRYALQAGNDRVTRRLTRHAAALFAPEDSTAGQRLSSQVKGLIWRFYDGNNWLAQWDSRSLRRLPVSVEMSLIIQQQDQELSFLSAVDLPGAGAGE